MIFIKKKKIKYKLKDSYIIIMKFNNKNAYKLEIKLIKMFNNANH